MKNQLNRGYESSILPVGIRELVPDLPDTTARNDPPVALPQGPMLPKYVVAVGSIPEFSVIVPRLSNGT